MFHQCLDLPWAAELLWIYKVVVQSEAKLLILNFSFIFFPTKYIINISNYDQQSCGEFSRDLTQTKCPLFNLDYWESKFVQVHILILSNLKSYMYQTYDQKCKHDIYVIIKEMKWNELIKHIFRFKSFLLTVTWMYYNKENIHMYMYMVLGTKYLLSLHRY